MVWNGKEWHYIAVKILSPLFREIIAFFLPQQKTNVNFMKKWKMKISVMLQCFHKTILEFNQYQKSDKAPFIIYAYLECLTEKVNA